MSSYVEHANISVVDAQKMIQFLTAAIPEWKVRGGGKIDNWFGRPIEWFHVGDDHSYIAISSGGKGDEHPFRKNVYYLEDHGMLFEFIEYFSEKGSERNDYIQ
ncbi:TPA: VOC family protein [Vibrio parahaemolyticus]|nr:VOC family protein [Vibrio parahaemolyticus]